MQKIVCASLFCYMILQLFFTQSLEELKKADEITFSHAVCSNQYVERTQMHPS